MTLQDGMWTEGLEGAGGCLSVSLSLSCPPSFAIDVAISELSMLKYVCVCPYGRWLGQRSRRLIRALFNLPSCNLNARLVPKYG